MPPAFIPQDYRENAKTLSAIELTLFVTPTELNIKLSNPELKPAIIISWVV
jgi:hypothetical protein